MINRSNFVEEDHVFNFEHFGFVVSLRHLAGNVYQMGRD